MTVLRAVVLLAVAAVVYSPAVAQELTKNPHGKLEVECATCHGSAGWVPAQISPKFDHAKYGIPLTGAHAHAACRSCHAALDFHGTARDCASCHRDVHHGELGADCGRCHTARSFIDRSAMVRAHQLTRFPLSGAHMALDCESCHQPSAQGQMSFVNVGADCVDCHRAQFQAAKSPDHVAGAFPQDCGGCHAPTTWNNARFNHDATGFPLTGAHAPLPCVQCHTGGTFTALNSACVSCHQADYNGTNNPAHAAAGFPTTCASCHGTTDWTGASFDHTAFPIPHRTATKCVDCHTNPANYTSFVCTTCHTKSQTDPRHQGVGGYVWSSTNCYACHRNGRGG